MLFRIKHYANICKKMHILNSIIKHVYYEVCNLVAMYICNRCDSSRLHSMLLREKATYNNVITILIHVHYL